MPITVVKVGGAARPAANSATIDRYRLLLRPRTVRLTAEPIRQNDSTTPVRRSVCTHGEINTVPTNAPAPAADISAPSVAASPFSALSATADSILATIGMAKN